MTLKQADNECRILDNIALYLGTVVEGKLIKGVPCALAWIMAFIAELYMEILGDTMWPSGD